MEDNFYREREKTYQVAWRSVTWAVMVIICVIAICISVWATDTTYYSAKYGMQVINHQDWSYGKPPIHPARK